MSPIDHIANDWAGQTEAKLLDAALVHAPKLGWSQRMLAAATVDVGLSLAEAELLLPHGPRDLAALLSRRHDAAGIAILSAVDPTLMKVRERIRRGVTARCDAAFADQPALRRWMGFLALPPNLPLAVRLNWAAADQIWRWAGDSATDENHYSKRVLLSEILTSTMVLRLSLGANAAAAHLDRRIDAVMAFEKWKGAIKPATFGVRLAHGLGRLRYGRASP